MLQSYLTTKILCLFYTFLNLIKAFEHIAKNDLSCSVMIIELALDIYTVTNAKQRTPTVVTKLLL